MVRRLHTADEVARTGLKTMERLCRWRAGELPEGH